MTAPPVQSQEQQKQSDKEWNFRQLESKYEKQLAQERSEKADLQKALQERQDHQSQEDEDDSEPYVDKKKLNKTLVKFGQQAKQETQGEIQKAVQTALQQERQQNWIKNNPDFYDTLKHAERLAQKDPELAETILEMPDNFARQQLVYKNIKALGLHQDAPKQPSIQEKIDSNRRSPYYQPSGTGTAPYAASSDYSAQGQKQAYDKMKELQSRLRI